MIRIVCCFKMERDFDKVSREEWEEAARTGHIDLSYIKSKINASDEGALELSLRFRDATSEEGGSCVLEAVSAGGGEAVSALQTLAALGFEETTRILWEEDFAPAGTAAVLTEHIRGRRPDIVVCGSRSGAGCAGTVPILIGGSLGVRCIEGVTGFLPAGDDRIRVSYAKDGRLFEETVKLPVVLMVGDVQRCYLRVPTLKQRMASASQEVREASPDTACEESAELLGFRTENDDRETVFIDGTDPEAAAAAIYEKLLEEGVITR